MSKKIYSNTKNVLQAAQERVSLGFDLFDNISVSVSGGKDSTVLAHLVVQEAERRGRRVNMFFTDSELNYSATINQVDYLMNLSLLINKVWVQIPSVTQTVGKLRNCRFLAWDEKHRGEWVQEKRVDAITENIWETGAPPYGEFYIREAYEKSCGSNSGFFIGIRADESLERLKTVTRHPALIDGNKIKWATSKPSNSALLYPIYDFSHSDIWKYIKENNLKYNKIYDYQRLHSYPTKKMRVSNIGHQFSEMEMQNLPYFEPETYAKILERVEGTEIMQEHGNKSSLFLCKKLPEHFNSWKEYLQHLIKTSINPDIKVLVERFGRMDKTTDNYRQACRQVMMNDVLNEKPIKTKEANSKDNLLNKLKGL